MISFTNWIITDGGLSNQPCNIIFKDGFDNDAVVLFKSADLEVEFDFSKIDQLQLDQYPRLIARGLDADDKVNIEIYLRLMDGNLQIRISYLYPENASEEIWSMGLWQKVLGRDINRIYL